MSMERKEAIERINSLVGKNLHELASQYDITVVNPLTGKVNKGWAGHVIERCLGFPLNSAQSPNFGSWELKSVPIKLSRKGIPSLKETMAITKIDAYNVREKPFEESHLLSKLKKAVVVARTVGATYSEPSYIYDVIEFDLEHDEMFYNQVKADYELVRQILLQNPTDEGLQYLSGSMGVPIQPRTKGPGHGSISRAFYARKAFLQKYIDLSKPWIS